MMAPDVRASVVAALETAKRPLPPLTSEKASVCLAPRVSGSAAAMGAPAAVTSRPAARAAQVPAHVSSMARASVASVKAGGSFTSVSSTVTVAEARMPPPSVAVTSSAKLLCCGFS